MKQEFDFIVLGGGSAGYAAARTAREHCQRVAIIDGAEELSGLCILRGCMPSKTLIYSAEVLHHARHGGLFGLDIPQARANMPSLQARKKRVIAEFADYRKEQLASNRFTLFRQHGRLSGPHEIELADGTVLTAPRIFISTGSVIARPPVPGLDKVATLTSDDILNLDTLPESILVLGGGIVACELSQFLSRVGSKVIQIQRSPHILKETTPEAATVIEKAFRDEGIELFTGTKITGMDYDEEDNVCITFEHAQPDGSAKTVTRRGRFALNALGRLPNTANLGLDAAGVAIRKSGHIECDAFQQTSVHGVYAGGDCAGPHEIVHVAIRQGEVAAAHAFGKEARPVNYDHLMGVVFTDPQVAHVGLNEKQAQERGIDYAAADFPFDDHGKSILMEAKYGYVKVLAEKKTGRLIGAECVGKDGGELIHALTVPVACGLTARDCLKADWYHPTLGEIWTYPLEDLLAEIR